MLVDLSCCACSLALVLSCAALHLRASGAINECNFNGLPNVFCISGTYLGMIEQKSVICVPCDAIHLFLIILRLIRQQILYFVIMAQHHRSEDVLASSCATIKCKICAIIQH